MVVVEAVPIVVEAEEAVMIMAVFMVGSHTGGGGVGGGGESIHGGRGSCGGGNDVIFLLL